MHRNEKYQTLIHCLVVLHKLNASVYFTHAWKPSCCQVRGRRIWHSITKSLLNAREEDRVIDMYYLKAILA